MRPIIPPGVLYYASTKERARRIRAAGRLKHNHRLLTFSADEESAWKVAQRFLGEAKVLYIDARGALRAGVRFYRTRNGLYLAEELPANFVLNIDPRFGFQRAAGGALVRESGAGAEVAMILPAKGVRDIWELPKGKLTYRESYEEAALREVQEELGIASPLELGGFLGTIRYGFRTPRGEPRLKIVRFYFVRPLEPIERFSPPPKEIRQAQWFLLPEAIEIVAHDEVRPILRKAEQLARPGKGETR